MKLRKVKFCLGDADGFRPNMTPEDMQNQKDMQTEREGAFHCWIPAIVHNPQLNQEVPTILGLIEEISTGELHEIPTKHFHFVTPCEWVER